MKTRMLLLSAVLLFSSAASHADVILLDSGVGGLRSTSYFGAVPESVGYRYTLDSNRPVQAFGLYDGANNASTGFQGDGLMSPDDEVNLWTSTNFGDSSAGILLAISAPIPQSGADASGFIYQSLYTPFNGFNGTLMAGVEYVVSARYNTVGGVSQGSNIDAFRDSQDASNPIRSSFVSSLGPGQYSGHGNGYQMPNNVAGAGFVGPNIQVAGIPEAGAFWLGSMICAAACLVVAGRKWLGKPPTALS